MQELEWWAKNLELSNGRAILRQNDTKVTIQADASKKGWGAYCQNETIGGQWTQQESSLHINVLEMTAIKLALLTFSKTLELKGVTLPNRQYECPLLPRENGGTRNREMVTLAKEI